MKIILLCDSLIKGGKERRMIELIKGLSKEPGVHIELILFKNLIEYSEIYDLGIPLHIIERKPKHNPLTFWKVYKICREVRPDILHTWSSMSAIFAFPSKKLLNIKLLNGNIASAPRSLRIWNRDFFRAKLTFPFSDVIVGNSSAGLKAFKAPGSRSICIPNGFDFQRISNIEKAEVIKEKYKVGTHSVIGKIAAFSDRKDYDTFISAAQKVLQIRDDVIFFAIGDGPNFEKTKASVPSAIRDRIIFTGLMRNVESLINIFNIGVLSTNNDIHGEGISNSILEYMALGKPVIATEGGGTNEIVVDKETGFLVPPKSPEILAGKILEMLDNPAKSNKMGILGEKRIKDYFSLDKMTREYFQLYSKLAN
jgi:glycosyltransferase involved in cell wall biosynthesis